MSKPRIVERPALTIVGVEGSFRHALSPETNNFQVIPPLWDRLMELVPQVRHRVGDEMYGVIYGLPEDRRSHPHELQYIAGVAVSSTEEIPAGMVSRTIPAGMFAVVTHRGPIAKIGETCEYLYRTWLPASNYEQAEIADIECYDERFCPDGGDSEMEYAISVRQRICASSRK